MMTTLRSLTSSFPQGEKEEKIVGEEEENHHHY
jgi:hypothetical protein